MLSLDSSFQNSRPQRTGSLVNLNSSNVSPRSNKSAQKYNLSSKSIERGAKPLLSTKKPIQASNVVSKNSLSPLLVSKAQNHRKDLESEIQKGLEAMKKHKNTASKTASKPLSSRPVSSNTNVSTHLSSNSGFSELRKTNLEKLNESIDFQSQSISEMTENGLSQSRDYKKGPQLNPRGPEMRTGGSDKASVSSKSGKNSLDSSMCGPVAKKSRNNENLYKGVQGIQNVYAVKPKPLSLTNVLRSSSRNRNEEDERGVSKRNGSRSASKENIPASVQKVSAKKDSGNISVSGRRSLGGCTAKKADLISCRGLLTGLKEVENMRDNSVEKEKVKMTEGEEVDLEKYRLLESRCVRKNEGGEDNSELGFLRGQLGKFCGKLQGVVDEVVFREKRKFFIRLLEILHHYKLQLAQALVEEDKSEVIVENTEEGDEDEKELEEINMRSAAVFYNHKLLQKYFYQGLLGYYVISKMGESNPAPQKEEPVPAPVVQPKPASIITATRKSSQASLYVSRRSDYLPSYLTELKSQQLRSKSPVLNKTPIKESIQARKSTNSIKKPTNQVNQSFRVSYGGLSPNQSFVGPSRDKITKKAQSSHSVTRKSSRVLGDTSQLDCSFGETNPRRASERFMRGYETGQVNASRTRKGLNDNDLVPDQILTNIPKPIKKEGLASFDTPRMEDRRFTIDFVSHGNNTSYVRSKNDERKSSKGPCKSDFKVKEGNMRAYDSRESIASTTKKRYEGKREDSYRSGYGGYNAKTKRTDLEEENQEISAAKLAKALEFRKSRLLKTYSRPFVNKLVELVNNKLEAVWYLRIRGLLRRGFMGLFVNCRKSPEPTGATEVTMCEEREEDAGMSVKNLMESEYEGEEESIVEDKLRSAQEYFEMNMKINVFNAILENFVKGHEENKAYNRHRESYLMRSCFVKWFEAKAELRREKKQLKFKEQKEDEEDYESYNIVADKFRFIILTEKVMRGLKEYVQESIEALSPMESVPKEESAPEKLV